MALQSECVGFAGCLRCIFLSALIRLDRLKLLLSVHSCCVLNKLGLLGFSCINFRINTLANVLDLTNT